MTLAQDARHLLLDEPLSALDMKHARDMMRHLRTISEQRNIGVVIVIHDINTAAAYSDRIVAMRDGVIVAEGSPEAVITPGTIEDVFGVTAHVVEVDGRPVVVPIR